MIFDNHTHLISDDHERYPPAPLSGQLRPGDLDDPMTVERLLREMDAVGVERAVVVQRAHVYGYDNSYVVDAAERYPDRLTAVCSVNALATDIEQSVRHWVSERGATGLRMTEPYKGADSSWFASDEARPLWELADALGVSVCLHFYRWNRLDCLAALPGVLNKFPNVNVVVDHVSNIIVEEGAPDYGVDQALEDLREYRNLVLKLTTINLNKISEHDIDPSSVVKRVVENFGVERLMWGSDVAQTKGAYSDMVAAARDAMAGLDERERYQVLYGVSDRVYGGNNE